MGLNFSDWLKADRKSLLFESTRLVAVLGPVVGNVNPYRGSKPQPLPGTCRLENNLRASRTSMRKAVGRGLFDRLGHASAYRKTEAFRGDFPCDSPPPLFVCRSRFRATDESVECVPTRSPWNNVERLRRSRQIWHQ